jgi:hypothetical protein
VQIDDVFYREADRLHGVQPGLMAINTAVFPSAVPLDWPP